MPIISVRDNENNRWNRNAKQQQQQQQKNKDRKEQGGIKAIVKGWELNDYVVHLSYVFFN